MSADDECEEWVGWVDYKPVRTIRVTARIRRVGRRCVACGHIVSERELPPYADHADDCALVAEWGRERDTEMCG